MPDEKTVKTVPELVALKLATLYGDGSTTLVSLTHRVCIADFDAEVRQYGIPHLHVTTAIEDAAGKAYFGPEFDAEKEGWPGWEAIFQHLEKHPDLLEPVEPDAEEDEDEG